MISIVIPAYNCKNSIIKTLDSLEKQSFKDFEVIIIDDGSTDNTLETIKLYNKKHDNIKINVFYQKNAGPGSARNLGLSKASGVYVVFIDSDDVVEYNYLDILFRGIKEGNCEFAFSTYYRIVDNDLKSKRVVTNAIKGICDAENVFASFICNRTYISLWNAIFSRKIIENNNIKFIDNCYSGEDIVFITNYLLQCKKVNVISIPIYTFYFDSKRAKKRLEYKTVNRIEESIYWPLLEKVKKAQWHNGYKALLNGKFAVYSALQLLRMSKRSSTYKQFCYILDERGGQFLKVAKDASPKYMKLKTYIKTKIVWFLVNYFPYVFYKASHKL